MKLDDLRRSTNIEDRRGGGMGGGFGGGGGGFPVRTGGFGLIIIILFMIFGGGDLSSLLGGAPSQGGTSNAGFQGPDGTGAPVSESADEAVLRDRVAAVLGSTEDFWGQYFASQNQRYEAPTLVLFTDRTASACGAASQASGPFYCPADSKVYLDLGFFNEMEQRLGARGDFAQAYVIAHEIGHHVQDQIGLLSQAHQAMARNENEAHGANSVSVRVELMADCLAGFWAQGTLAKNNDLEPGDVEEGIAAAQAVGDDRLQSAAQGYAVPDSFTHGTSAQRARWFMAGMAANAPEQCDTFQARSL